MEWTGQAALPCLCMYRQTVPPKQKPTNSKPLDGWEAELRETQYTKVGEGPRSQADFTVLKRNYIMQYIQPWVPRMYVCMYVCQRPSIQFLRVSWGLDYGWQYCVSRQELLNCSRNTLWGGYVLFCLLCIREARRKRAGDVSMGGTIGKPPFNYKVLQYT